MKNKNNKLHKYKFTDYVNLCWWWLYTERRQIADVRAVGARGHGAAAELPL